MTPRRRPLTRGGLDVEMGLRRAVSVAPAVELGWACLLADMRDAGWPARIPEGDRKRSSGWSYARCNATDCGAVLDTPAAKMAHQDATGHAHYAYKALPVESSSGIDYADPTGDEALRFARDVKDLMQLQDDLMEMSKRWRRIVETALRHLPVSSPSVPACSVTSCENPVESRKMPNGVTVYVGMESVAGHWVIRDGQAATCVRHREHRGEARAS